MDAAVRHEIVAALRARFESDEILGARVLPLSVAGLPQASVQQTGPYAPAAARATASACIEPPAAPPLPPPPPVSADELERRAAALRVIDEGEVRGCTRCGLHAGRTKTVFGVGRPAARIMFIGEAPGHDEDVSGEPFVGRAGQLLTDMIQKGMGLRREDVYICNVIKCRPPENRTPAHDEIAACRDYLWRQIDIVRPQVIIALGAPAAQTLLNTREGIGRLRGRWHDFYPSGTAMIGEAIPLLATFHPAYLLRSPGEKAKAWADLKMVMARLGIPIPARR